MSEIESKQTNNPSFGRRKFLTKTAAAVVVGSIPAKSVWANGITNSIVASGHGSDFAGGRNIELLSPCSLLTLLNENTSAYLDKNFKTVFGEGPDKLFSEILGCHCGCPKKLRHAISNVVFRVSTGSGYKRFKVGSYTKEHGEILNANDPTRYYDYIESFYNGGTVVDYVIKAGQKLYNPQGEEVTIANHSWYTGWSGGKNSSHYDDKTKANESKCTSPVDLGDNCDGDDITLAMIAMYLNATFDFYFRGGTDPQIWEGANGIYYPILRSSSDEINLVNSIISSKNELNSILDLYESDTDLTQPCPVT